MSIISFRCHTTIHLAPLVNQATILMVTHDPFSASFCERILFLKDGKIFNEI